MSEATVTVVLWGLAALVLGWTWLPAMISALGGARYANGGIEDPAALESADEPDYTFWHRQLVALGYEALGPAWMRISFHGPQWRYETQVRVFYSRGKHAYAFIQKQPRPMDVWWLTMFATVWQDGALLLTSNAVDERPGDGEFAIQGVESTNLATVEALHLGQHAKLQAAGNRPQIDGGLEALLQAAERHSGPAGRLVALHRGQAYLATHGVVHFFMSLPAAILLGPEHWGVPLGNAVLAVLFNMSDYLAKWRAGALMRSQVHSQTVGMTQ
jgi:hypothetical protein